MCSIGHHQRWIEARSSSVFQLGCVKQGRFCENLCVCGGLETTFLRTGDLECTGVPGSLKLLEFPQGTMNFMSGGWPKRYPAR